MPNVSSKSVSEVSKYLCRVFPWSDTKCQIHLGPKNGRWRSHMMGRRLLLIISLFCFCYADELSALRQLYVSTNGGGWRNNTGWSGPSNDPCSFHGVTCTNGSVARLNLRNNGLSGSIPDVFDEFIFLNFVDLALNSLMDVVPDSIWTHPNITTLRLSQNFLHGTVPPYISSMKKLETILLDYNRFYGRIPSELCTLLSLSTMSLTANSFVELCDLSLVEHLINVGVAKNLFEGPLPSVPPSVLFFDGSQNSFSGPIPSSFYNCTQLGTLLLDSNQLNGSISEDVIQWKSMQWISMKENQLTGNLPNNLGRLSELTWIFLSGNLLTGEIPDTLSRSQSLQILDLTDNSLVGSIPESFKDIHTLLYLTLGVNPLSGTIPVLPKSLLSLQIDNTYIGGSIDNITTAPNLRIFYADLSQISGRVPDGIVNMTGLTSFSVSNCHLSGPLPKFSPEAKLTQINFSNNNLSGPLHDQLGTSAELISLDHNRLSGWMSPNWKRYNATLMTLLLNDNLITNDPSGDNQMSVIRNMNQLISFSVANNQLSGPMPNDVFLGLDNLQIFDVSGNEMNGTIHYSQYYTLQFDYLPSIRVVSECIQKCLNLMYQLDLSRNQFTGVLPLLLACDQLQTINMSHNQFVDYVPVEWRTMDQLQSLDLSNNRLIGSLRKSIGLFKSLMELYLDNNLLEGDIPQQIGSLSVQTLSLSGNRLTAKSLAFLSPLIYLQHLNLSDNQIRATLPDTLSESLITMDVSHNDIYGEIPEQLYTIRTLNTINMRGNELTGQLRRFNSDPKTLDLSDNRLSGNVSFLSQLSYISTLRLNGNFFTGALPSLEGRKNLVEMDLSNNQMSGQLPNFMNLLSLQFVNVSKNQFSGRVPLFTGSNRLDTLDLSHNEISYAIDTQDTVVLPSNISCDMSNNMMRCPIGWHYRSYCNADCTVQGSNTEKTVLYHMEGDTNTFSSSTFLSTLSSLGNITRDRLSITDIKSGSVIATVMVQPAADVGDSSNQGSVEDTIAVLKGISASVYNDSGIDLVSPIDTQIQATSTNNNNAIIGGVVGGFVSLVIITTIVFLLYRNWLKRQNHTAFHLVDLTQLNTSVVKRSLIEFHDITHKKMIGSGGFGVVYRGKWRDTEVAVKQIKAEHVTQKQLEDFIHEGLKSHPNIVMFVGVSLPPQPLSLVTEYCSGGSLLHYLRNNECDMEDKVKFMKEIALGMLHLHKEKVIHRDLAVRNILLSKHMEAKVADFGLSRVQESTDVTGHTQSFIGPLKWMSPEAIRDRKYSTKSDVFSFGVVMWEIVEADEPWGEESAVSVAIRVTTNRERLPVSSQWPEPLSDIVQRCWLESPGDRPNFEEIGSLLREYEDPGKERTESRSSEVTTYSGSNDVEKGGYVEAVRTEENRPYVDVFGMGREEKKREEKKRRQNGSYPIGSHPPIACRDSPSYSSVSVAPFLLKGSVPQMKSVVLLLLCFVLGSFGQTINTAQYCDRFKIVSFENFPLDSYTISKQGQTYDGFYNAFPNFTRSLHESGTYSIVRNSNSVTWNFNLPLCGTSEGPRTHELELNHSGFGPSLVVNTTNYCSNDKKLYIPLPTTDDSYCLVYNLGPSEIYTGDCLSTAQGRTFSVDPTDAGTYSIILKDSSNFIYYRYNFDLNECPYNFGTSLRTDPSVWCSNHKKIVITIPVATKYYLSYGNYVQRQYYLYYNFNSSSNADTFYSLDSFYSSTSVISDYVTDPTSSGYYEIVTYSDVTGRVASRYSFNLPDCGQNFGPDLMIDTTKWCANHKKMVATFPAASLTQLSYGNLQSRTYYLFYNYNTTVTTDSSVALDWTSTSTSVITSWTTDPTASGSYQIVSYSLLTKNVASIYSFELPDCGQDFGPDLKVDTTQWCTNHKKMVATFPAASLTKLSYGNLQSRTYYLFYNYNTTVTTDSSVALDWTSTSTSVITSWTTDPTASGSYQIVSYSLLTENVASIYSFVLPNCGPNFGPDLMIDTTKWCANHKKMVATFPAASLTQLSYGNLQSRTYYLFYNYNTTVTTDSSVALDWTSTSTSVITSWTTDPTASGSYQIVSYSLLTKNVASIYSFELPDCGQDFGPDLKVDTTQWCANYKKMVATFPAASLTKLSYGSLQSRRYYLFYNYNTTVYSESTSALANVGTSTSATSTYTADPTFPGIYQFVSYSYLTGEVASRYTFTLPICSSDFGPDLLVNTSSSCDNFKRTYITLPSGSRQFYLYYQFNSTLSSDYTSAKQSWSTSGSVMIDISAPGTYSVVSYGQFDKGVAFHYTFELPRCSASYGPVFNSLSQTSWCRNYRSVNITLPSSANTLPYGGKTRVYYLYKDFSSQSAADVTQAVSQFSSSVASYQISSPGTYSLVSYGGYDQGVVSNYAFTLTECDDVFGPTFLVDQRDWCTAGYVTITPPSLTTSYTLSAVPDDGSRRVIFSRTLLQLSTGNYSDTFCGPLVLGASCNQTISQTTTRWNVSTASIGSNTGAVEVTQPVTQPPVTQPVTLPPITVSATQSPIQIISSSGVLTASVGFITIFSCWFLLFV
ncbi:putative leucine-rich repeat receptor-like protein kinase [Planoprotostelium fungivorum]|uniref:Putative leucine-rich repeat receptor-like protein kinase n=1 Tax=Planoprotostelium fungivorum TaxID=1890364 RepID=A0A2P6MWT2_9EUKA|nr:putative leucine-rich repeat receptor-like protein kinase [Planoprotostelium fungivorum]